MGTPCAIGMKMEDGSVKAVRCNYDGYVAGAGAILGGWYGNAAKVEALLALGELSQLAGELAACVAYHRDRHEPMCPAKLFASVEEYQRSAKGDMSADYLYLYDGGDWLVHGKKRWQTCRICLIFEPVDLSRLFIKARFETLMVSSSRSNELGLLKIVEKGWKILC